MLNDRFRHFLIPMLVGNILCGAAFFLFVFNPPYSESVLFLSLALVAFVFFGAGLVTAISHKQAAFNFSPRQSVADGFWGGFASSLIFAIFLSSAFVVWIIIPIPFIAGLIGALGGGGWGIAYPLFFTKQNS